MDESNLIEKIESISEKASRINDKITRIEGKINWCSDALEKLLDAEKNRTAKISRGWFSGE